MLARTGCHGSGVGRRVPEMRRIVVFNCASNSPLWAERHHTGAQYTVTEKHPLPIFVNIVQYNYVTNFVSIHYGS